MPTTLTIDLPPRPTIELLLDGPEVYYISGTVTDADSNPAERTIRIYDRTSGDLVDNTQSDAGDGSFSFDLGTVGPTEYYVVAVAEGAEEPDLIHRVMSGHD